MFFFPLCKVFLILLKLRLKIVKATFVNSLQECFCAYIHHIVVYNKLNLICQYIQITINRCSTSCLTIIRVITISSDITILTLELNPTSLRSFILIP